MRLQQTILLAIAIGCAVGLDIIGTEFVDSADPTKVVGGITINATSDDDQITLLGGDDDTIEAFAGDDIINGGDGDDFNLYGGNGADTIIGGNGDDSSLLGGSGEDTIFGGPGYDSAYGGSENDKIYGGAGNDTLHGNDGDDLLAPGPGINTVYGENGNDTFKFGSDDGQTTVMDFAITETFDVPSDATITMTSVSGDTVISIDDTTVTLKAKVFETSDPSAELNLVFPTQSPVVAPTASLGPAASDGTLPIVGGVVAAVGVLALAGAVYIYKRKSMQPVQSNA